MRKVGGLDAVIVVHIPLLGGDTEDVTPEMPLPI
jgi:hypothetical protein